MAYARVARFSRYGKPGVIEDTFLATTFMGGYYLIDVETKERAIALAQPIPDAGIDGLAPIRSDLCEGASQKALLVIHQQWATPTVGDAADTHAPHFCMRYAALMLIYSMSVSADGFINDRNGGIDWTAPSDELFGFHLDRVRGIGGHLLGRKLYEAMLVWETDLSLRATPLYAEFAEVWTALPKVVFSRTLASVQGNARLANASLLDEIETMLASTDKHVEIGGASLAAQAFELGMIDDVRMFRTPIVLGAGTPFLPPLDRDIPLELVESSVFEPGIVYEHYRTAST